MAKLWVATIVIPDEPRPEIHKQEVFTKFEGLKEYVRKEYADGDITVILNEDMSVEFTPYQEEGEEAKEPTHFDSIVELYCSNRNMIAEIIYIRKYEI